MSSVKRMSLEEFQERLGTEENVERIWRSSIGRKDMSAPNAERISASICQTGCCNAAYADTKPA